MRTKRLRIFAGPNGSGKSVLYEYFPCNDAHISYVLLNFNQDELEANWKLALEGEQIFKINPLQ